MITRRHLQKKKGFTLIELLVAIGLFSVIMALASGAYLIIINLNRNAQAVALVSNNVSFVFENMTRSMRTGSQYKCNGIGDCANGGTSFTFRDQDGILITYTFKPAVGSVKGYVEEVYNGGAATQLTDPSVDITTLTFYVSGTTVGDYIQPFVRMIISGQADAGHGQTFSFSVETAATMRNIDI